MASVDLERFFETEKQREFSTDFFEDAEDYEVWEAIDFETEDEIPGERTFEIKAEDMKFYAAGALDDNPLFTDEAYAKKSPYRELLPHPIFHTQIIFWCIGTKGRGNWIRTPGARNPGQYLEIYEPFRVGETVHLGMRPHDRWIKRGKYYLSYEINMYNQDNVKKAKAIGTLILPRSRQDIRKFIQGLRGLDD
jgi:acyl dehydratase